MHETKKNTFEVFCEDNWVNVHEVRRLWVRKVGCIQYTDNKKLPTKENSNPSFVCKLNKQQVNPWLISPEEVEAFFPSLVRSPSGDWIQVHCDSTECFSCFDSQML
jgi:hypothetical protein